MPKRKGILVHAYCIMPSHLHLIISAVNNNLSDITREFKKFTSAKILKTIEENNKESRRNWMLWIFKKAGEKNERNTTYPRLTGRAGILAAGKPPDRMQYRRNISN